MNRIIAYIVIGFICCGCSKVADTGPYTIEGRLLNNCEEQAPVANTLLYFLVDYDMPDEERIAYTDDQGYFKYSYEGPGNNESVIGGSIRLSSDNPVLCGIPNFPSDRNMDAGDVYVNTPREADILFRVKGAGFTAQDTLVISRSFHTDLLIVSDFKVAGPFDEAVEIHRDWLRYATSGTGHVMDYAGFTRPHVRRLHGTYGTQCFWQLIRNGEVYSENNVEIQLAPCASSGTLEINPNDDHERQ